MEEQEEKECSMQEKVKTKVEEIINNIISEDLQPESIDCLGKLIDIHKDLANEKYWQIKEENYMRYRGYGENYGNYGDGSMGGNYGSYGRRSRDSRGRYTEGGSYGRRGVPGSGRGRYRGHEMLDEMYGAYGDYNDSKMSGRYGAEESEALDYMLQSLEEFMMLLKEEAETPEEIEKIKRTARKISEM